mgnify:CR=1 FL=1
MGDTGVGDGGRWLKDCPLNRCPLLRDSTSSPTKELRMNSVEGNAPTLIPDITPKCSFAAGRFVLLVLTILASIGLQAGPVAAQEGEPTANSVYAPWRVVFDSLRTQIRNEALSGSYTESNLTYASLHEALGSLDSAHAILRRSVGKSREIDEAITSGTWRYGLYGAYGAEDRILPSDSMLQPREIQTDMLIVALYPTSAEAWSTLGTDRGNAGDTYGSLEAHDRAIQLEPDSIQWRLAKGASLIAGGQLGRAREYYDSLRMLARWNPAELYWRSAVVDMRSGMTARAAATFRDAFRSPYERSSGTVYPIIYGDTAVALMKATFGLEPTYRILNDALENDSSNTMYRLLGDAYSADNRFADALPYYRKALALNPASGRLHLKVASTLFELSRFEEAYRTYEEAFKQDSALTSALFNMGASLSNLSRLAEGLRWYAEYVVRVPDDPDGWVRLGNNSFGLSNRDSEAVSYFERAFLLDPAVFDENAMARERWEKALAKVGKQPPATVGQVRQRLLASRPELPPGTRRGASAPQRSSSTTASAPPPKARVKSTGSGIIVSSAGTVLTNAHVVEACREVRVAGADGVRHTARVGGADGTNDLALLWAPGLKAAGLAFRVAPVRPGQPIVTLGYPLTGLLAPQVVNGTGSVSSLAGLNNDARMLQISAPVQAGNSGGPVVDLSGAVIGVVVSKLDAARVYELTGDIPQNVNFAIKGSIARTFLEANGVTPMTAAPSPEESVPDVVERVKASTVLIECLK